MKRLLSALLLVVLVPAVRADGEFLGKKTADWIKDLSDTKVEVRRGGAFALGKCAAVEAVPHLVRVLGDNNAAVREAAAYAIGDIAAERPRAALWSKVGEPLRKMLAEDDDTRARRSAAYAIGQFGPDGAAARPELEQALEHKDAAVRQNAAWALGRLKEKAGELGVKQLGRALRDEDATVRRDAAAALREIGLPTAAAGVRPLVDCLGHEKTPGVRIVVVGSLVELVGPMDKEAAADLSRFLKDPDRDLRHSAALALSKIGGAEAKAAVALLVEALDDDDADVRERAAIGLAYMGEAAGDAVTKLGQALSDRSPVVRRNAALALMHIGKRSGEVIRSLVRALDAKEPAEVRQFAAEAISTTEQAVNTVVADLLPLIKDDPNKEVRQHLVMALRNVRDLDKGAVAEVMEKVLDETGDKDRIVRYDAARVLAYRLQDRAPAKVVSVLEGMLNDPNLREDKGVDPTLRTGDESVKGSTGARQNLGGDARYMAAKALAEVARNGKRDDALRVLRAAAESNDEIKKKVAAEALKDIGKR